MASPGDTFQHLHHVFTSLGTQQIPSFKIYRVQSSITISLWRLVNGFKHLTIHSPMWSFCDLTDPDISQPTPSHQYKLKYDQKDSLLINNNTLITQESRQTSNACIFIMPQEWERGQVQQKRSDGCHSRPHVQIWKWNYSFFKSNNILFYCLILNCSSELHHVTPYGQIFIFLHPCELSHKGD